MTNKAHSADTHNSESGQKILLTHNQLFWVLNISAWMALGAVWYVSYTLTFDQSDLPYLIHPVVQSVLGIFVSWPMRYIFHWSWNKPLGIQVPIVFTTVILSSLTWTFVRLVTFVWITGETKNFLPEFGLWYFPGLLVFSCWAALYHGFQYYHALQVEHTSLLKMERQKHEERLRRKNAEHLAHEAQLKMLRYQMNPHFLFNTMNAITSLVNAGRNPEAADMIEALSVFLRDTLQGDPLRRVSLREEIRSLENYLSIEQVRFGERLKIEIETADADPDFRVPGLILQPLAENVVKHVVRPASGTVTLSVEARMVDGQLEIEINDDGPGISGLENTRLPEGGLGLQNVHDRLANIYGTDHVFLLETRNSGGLRVLIRIPPERDVTMDTFDQVGSPDG